jgi:hypothetical protein
MNIKQAFGIDHLVTEYAYSKIQKTILRNGKHRSIPDTSWCLIEQMFDYPEWLNETPLTESMFQEGGIFEGFEQDNSNDLYTEYSNGVIVLRYGSWTKKEDWAIMNEYEHYNHIQTLADLARLTSDSPIPLR